MMKKNKINIKIIIVLVIALIASSTIIAQEAVKTKPTQAEHLQNLEALKVKRDSTIAVIVKMELPALVDQMNKDSKIREHFNSTAYREIVHNRKDQGQALFDMIVKQQSADYISLMALRKINKEGFDMVDAQIKINALSASLNETVMYNRWGIPHLYWQSPAKSIIELGTDAEAKLKGFLNDTSPAKIMGYEETIELEAYKYRKCDYALAMIMAIRGENVKEIPKNPEDRDKMIEDILAE